ncbi:MAG: transporter [Bacteroidetes bacterium]|nr:MAG: transporter [Bacteroidota bacterium]
MIFNDLFSQESTASTLLFIALVGIVGILLGKLNIGKLKLGIAGVLFVGLLVGHFGAKIDPHVLHFIKEFGLILFVYSIGIEIGPRFISSFKNNGIRLNGLAAGIVLLGALIAYGIKVLFDLEPEVIAGLMCGAVTNTPSLGATQSLIMDQFVNGRELSQVSGMAYAIAYPFGIIGIILSMYLIRVIFRISVPNEQQKFIEELDAQSSKAVPVNINVTNPNLFNKSLKFIKSTLDNEFVFSRILRAEDYIIPDNNLIVKEGDVFIGLCSEESIPQLELKIGDVSPTGKYEISGDLSMRHVLITNKKIAGRSLRDINLPGLFPANITRIFRSGSEIIPTANNFLEFGDTVRVVGERDKMDEVIRFLGNSQRDLSNPNLIPVFLGIFLGVVLGSIPVFIPGLPAPAKLGLAGGPLIVALILGHKGRIGSFNFYMTPSANRFIREFGIVLFLACVGLGSGGQFFETLINGGYMWMLYATLITFLPLVIIGIIGYFLKINYLTVCGLLAGSMTDPPALEFASSIAPVQAQTRAYATVYPLTMFLRILVAQILVLMLT